MSTHVLDTAAATLRRATRRSVLRGFVLPEDADDVMRPALESDVGR